MATSPSLHIYYGADGFSAREALRKQREELGVSDANVVRLEGRSTPVSEIAAAAHTATFFAEPRLVIIEGLSERFSARRRSGSRPGRARNAGPASALDQIVGLLSDLPDSTTVVLLEEQPAPGFLDAFKGVATVSQFFMKRGDDMRRWADARFKERGGSITAAAIERLCEIVDGSHLGELAQEIDKLVAYAGGRRIEVTDIDEVASGAISHQTWDLTDAVVAGRADRALRVLQRMDEKQHPKQLLLSMVVRQYRQVLLAQAMLREGFSDASVSSNRL